jgi:penicillin amidase
MCIRDSRTLVPSQGEAAIRRLLTERPPQLLPEGRESWEAVLDDALDRVRRDVARAGGPDRYRWGEVGRAGVAHPLARMLPPLAWVVNPRDVAVPGDRATVRAQARGFGASQRFAVTPGREAEGIFHMPGGQSGKPAAPWYLAGHTDWIEGRATPFLPGPTRYRLVLTPAA